MRHILDQENWLAPSQSGDPIIARALPVTPILPPVPHAGPDIRAPIVALVGGGGPYEGAATLISVLSIVVGCVALFNLVDGAAAMAVRR